MAEHIERKALIAHIKDLPTWWADGGGVYGKAMKYPDGMFDCDDILNSIENAPAADVAPVRHGRWTTNSNRPDKLICSICNVGFDMWKHDRHNYCPKCGAKMDLEA